MKIAFLHFWTLRLPRGVETLTLSLANALALQGHAVSLLCARHTRDPLVYPLPHVQVHEFPTFRYFEATTIVPFYAHALVHGHYDVVITFFADFGEGHALHLAAPFKSFKQVLYLTFPYESAPHRYHAYKKFGWDKCADVLLADAAFTARQGEGFFGRSVAVLPSGTDPERFKPDAAKRATMRRQLGFGEQDIVLLNVSALEPRKGTWRVIEALPKVRAVCPTVRYLIMGDGPERTRLEQRAVDLGVREAVLFGGTTSDLTGYYNAADIFVMLSDVEAGSVALLEAMASELTVIVSNSGGFDEVISSAIGRTVRLESPAEFTEAVLGLASNGLLRTEMGCIARQKIMERYSWKQIAADLVASLH